MKKIMEKGNKIKLNIGNLLGNIIEYVLMQRQMLISSQQNSHCFAYGFQVDFRIFTTLC